MSQPQASAAVLLLTSCDKDDDEPANVTPTVANVAGSYKITAATANGVDVFTQARNYTSHTGLGEVGAFVERFPQCFSRHETAHRATRKREARQVVGEPAAFRTLEQ